MDKILRRNFNLGVLNGALFNAALAFLSGSTIMPVFISQLTDSRVVIGLFSTMESFGWFFPQLFMAVFIAHRSKVLGFYNNLSGLRLFLFGAAIAGIFIFRGSPKSILISFGASFALLSLAAGFAGAAFTEIVGKTIPINKRGSYFGLRMFIGGSLAALEGIAAKRIISAFPFPDNFGYLYSAAWVLMLLGLLTFAFIREPEAKDTIEKASPGFQLKSALRIFKNDANFRKLFWSRACIHTYFLSSPFYIVFAISKLGASDSIAGLYLAAQMTGYLSANLIWAWLSNHVSNRKVIMFASLLSAAPPLISLGASFFPVAPLSFSAVFLLLGMAESGIGMGYVNYLLESVPEKGRLLSIGLMHTLIAPTVFFSALGGLLSQVFSLRILFLIVCLTTLAAYLISSKLHEPRQKKSISQSPGIMES